MPIIAAIAANSVVDGYRKKCDTLLMLGGAHNEGIYRAMPHLVAKRRNRFEDFKKRRAHVV